MGSNLGSTHCHNLKRQKGSYCCYRVGGMPWSKIGATYYHTQLGLIVNDHTIRELVFCWVLLNLIPRIDIWTGKERFGSTLLYLVFGPDV